MYPGLESRQSHVFIYLFFFFFNVFFFVTIITVQICITVSTQFLLLYYPVIMPRPPAPSAL